MFLKGMMLTLFLVLSVTLTEAGNYSIGYKAENLLVKEEVPYKISLSVKSYVVNASCVGGIDYPDSGYLAIFLNSPYSNTVHRYDLDPSGIYRTVDLTYSYQIMIESFCPGNISTNITFYYPPPDITAILVVVGILGLGFATMLIALFVKIGFSLQKKQIQKMVASGSPV